ncbi:MAG: DUF1848 domain-containing protein [Schwartzia sp.]|nr:DUF1848 domain-containing protein [Schwartzia sp. (in: firmicutes)]
MIISASRRTDIPAFYFDWFCKRLKEGFADVVNPFNRRQVSRISLKPDFVDCIVFWTKDPAPMLEHLDSIQSYPYYVQISITPYGRDVETNLRPKEEIIGTVQELSRRIGKERVVWRYDPILLNEQYTMEKHFEWFKGVTEELSPYTERCVISFIDLYAKAKKNTQGLNLHELSEEEMMMLAEGLSDIVKGSGITLQTCSEAVGLEQYGIIHGACIDGELVSRIAGKHIKTRKAKTQRPLCNCVESFDIGQYDTCIHGCRYCYANASPERAATGFENHNTMASVITGGLTGDEKITLHENDE